MSVQISKTLLYIPSLKVLEIIQEAILATDLVLFFGNNAKMVKILEANAFNWSNPEHRFV